MDRPDILDQNYETRIIREKYDFIEEIIHEVLLHKEESDKITDRLDKVLTDRVWGIPVFLLIMVGAVFVFSPAKILGDMWEPAYFTETFGPYIFWIAIVFIYYLIATMMPIDKIIGRIYPLFAFSLLFMAGALMVMLFVKQPDIPELWEGVSGDLLTTKNIFPCLFITIACGAISGFHATQTPLMARCVKNEKMGRPMFYGAMITEGIVALIWATVAMYFFYDEPMPGYQLMGLDSDATKDAPTIVNLICNDWLGVAGGILALLGVVAAPITSGDTALRSCRLIIADFLKLEQRSIRNRLYVCIPLFIFTMGLLIWQMADKEGFNILWSWFGWSNQALSVFTLWAITVYLVRQKRNYIITLIPALFMTVVCTTFFFAEKVFTLSGQWPWIVAGAAFVVALVWFVIWYLKFNKTQK